MNNFKNNNNRRSRFKPNGDRGYRRNGNGHKTNGDFNNGSSFKKTPRENNQNAQNLEKYNDLAREALQTNRHENYFVLRALYRFLLLRKFKKSIWKSTKANINNQIRKKEKKIRNQHQNKFYFRYSRFKNIYFYLAYQKFYVVYLLIFYLMAV